MFRNSSKKVFSFLPILIYSIMRMLSFPLFFAVSSLSLTDPFLLVALLIQCIDKHLVSIILSPDVYPNKYIGPFCCPWNSFCVISLYQQPGKVFVRIQIWVNYTGICKKHIMKYKLH